jgi:outer membrane protein assembly factor BamB
MRTALLVTTAVFCAAIAPAAAEGIGWRGDGTGIYQSAKPPTQWSGTKNILWKTPLPGPSKGSPIVVGDSIFTLAYPNSLLCLNRADGKVLWQKTHACVDAVPGAEGARLDAEFPAKAIKDLYWPAGDDLSQTTPVSDGKAVYCVFGNGVVSAHAHDGNRQWMRFIERPKLKYGHATSPVLAGGFLIVHINDLIALDPKTGREVWRAQLPASHSTPAVARIGSADVIVHPSGALVGASDGKILAKGLFKADRGSPIVHGRKVYVHGESSFVAIELPETIASPPGKIWEAKATPGGYTIASPVLHDGRLYGTNRNGVLEVIDAATGPMIYQERLPLGNKVYSGIALAGGLLYLGNEKGTQLVIRPGSRYDEVAANELGELINAAPVFADDRLYLRTEKHLVCIGNP